MKIKRYIAALFAVVVTLGFAACADKNGGDKSPYIIAVDSSLPFTVEVGETIDYKQYFVVVKDGVRVEITDDMLDLSKADTSVEGEFTVTLKVGNSSEQITFTVVGGEVATVDELAAILKKYSAADWVQNFAAKVTVNGSDADYTDNYEYYGENVKWSFEDDEGDSYTDYVGYDAATNKYTYYYDNGDGTYKQYGEETDENDFWDNYLNMNLVDLSQLTKYEYDVTNDGFSAKTPGTLGNAALGEFEDSTWTAFTLNARGGNVTKITATTSDGYTFTYVLSKFGAVSFTLPGGTTKPTTPTGAMDKQTYNAATFDDGRLQSKLTTAGDEPDPYVGLPSTGTYAALVVPVKFSDKTISSTQLSNLNLAFNDTTNATGWESVKSYYQKASYGKLNLSFDIAGYNMGDDVDYYRSSHNYSYYAGLTTTENGETYNNGDNVLLHEVLAHYEEQGVDLSKYDYNKDGAIDAVYLIYSGDVDYDSDDSFYWAYVTWNYEEKQYSGKDVFYYLFAGLGFMEESVKGGYTNEYYPVISGLKVNASTYIHETGHLLGLDDYYDYEPNKGCDEGLGGADMMDATVGDQNVYSKIMLGWLTPEIVVNTQTITIKSSQERGDAILIPLNFDNSYFCEYLLIDLYSAKGLNEMHANMSDSYLYGGASYGVRIYHVSAWITNPWSNDFGSFTDYDNSMSDIALIKLVEADGENKFASGDGYAESDDLWQAGDKLSEAFPEYTTNAGKTLIFDITIDSVSATEATITITYAA